ncbi:MAG TPA: hypothetical protein H9830_13805 [Candidatus Agrococcus pullicola]|uniref:Uncharacterized protein n=1 Tax=Candidatus Agrococcus pullicola TaxID=2838429 RepID=A0A9D2C9L1_9MICO|nr:hypothetical protein [Candidatus Agrococcus pullicola]
MSPNNRGLARAILLVTGMLVLAAGIGALGWSFAPQWVSDSLTGIEAAVPAQLTETAVTPWGWHAPWWGVAGAAVSILAFLFSLIFITSRRRGITGLSSVLCKRHVSWMNLEVSVDAVGVDE